MSLCPLLNVVFLIDNMIIMVTSDVQAVNATVVGESAIDSQCWFIHGSDALGCKVVLVSDHPTLSDEIGIFLRNTTYASRAMTLAHPVSCYLRVVAFDIESDNTTSNLTIHGKLINKTDTVCSGTNMYCYCSRSNVLINNQQDH